MGGGEMGNTASRFGLDSLRTGRETCFLGRTDRSYLLYGHTNRVPAKKKTEGVLSKYPTVS